MFDEVSCTALYAQLGLLEAPVLLDVRDEIQLNANARMIPGAVQVDAGSVDQWANRWPTNRQLLLYGDRIDPALPASLANHGFAVSTLKGGIEGWMQQALPTIRVRKDLGVPGGSQWITRERPKIDRVACPWLVRRFIDPAAMFFYVPAQSVRADAAVLKAVPYDIADVTFSHRGPRCSFDAFLDEFDLRDPVLSELAEIVCAADTGMLDRSKEAPGLLAIALGLSASITDDLLLLDQGMVVYDALYAWCKTAKNETHSWPKQPGSLESAARA
jgi:rhodanese-related sulfurtransferase